MATQTISFSITRELGKSVEITLTGTLDEISGLLYASCKESLNGSAALAIRAILMGTAARIFTDAGDDFADMAALKIADIAWAKYKGLTP